MLADLVRRKAVSPHDLLEAAIERHKPWAIVNTAGFVRTEVAEELREECFRANVTGPELLARACKRNGIPLVTFSSDLVFGGDRTSAYLESHPVRPLCVYGRSKAEAETRVLAALPALLPSPIRGAADRGLAAPA